MYTNTATQPPNLDKIRQEIRTRKNRSYLMVPGPALKIIFFSCPCLSTFFIKRKRNKVQRQQTGWFQRAETQPRKRYNKGKITQSAIRDPAIYQATTRAVLVAYNLPRTRQSTRPAAGRVTKVPSWRHDQKFCCFFSSIETRR